MKKEFKFAEGCIIDSHHGIYCNGMVVKLAEELGYVSGIDSEVIEKASAYFFTNDLAGDQWDAIFDKIDAATEYLNQFAPEGMQVFWWEGDLLCGVYPED